MDNHENALTGTADENDQPSFVFFVTFVAALVFFVAFVADPFVIVVA